MTEELAIPEEIIRNKIFFIRKQKVMIDRDLAILYQVETRVLKQAVRRNINRFPQDFMFEMNKEEFANWRSQFVISNSDQIGLRHLPFCFTEQGVAMLSSVLNSERAINVNIQIIRIFTRIRQQFIDNTELRLEVENIKTKLDNQDKNMEVIFRYLDELIERNEKPKPRKRIGFKSDDL